MPKKKSPRKQDVFIDPEQVILSSGNIRKGLAGEFEPRKTRAKSGGRGATKARPRSKVRRKKV